ncbi:MAG TPA: flagellar hook-basal body protein [Thermoleophilaceae bacterium]
MLEGLYSAAAGMAAQQQHMDAVANDLANVDTTGYKSLRTGFRDLLYTQAAKAAGPRVDVGAGAAATQLGRSLQQGSLQNTGRMLDVAISGQGFFQVRLPNGSTALTRDGNLHLDRNGRLVNSTGARVLPAITVPAGTTEDQVSIASDGTVNVAGRQLGRLRVVDVRSPEGLAPAGNNLFTTSAASGPVRAAGTGTTLQQGYLEGSNVDMADAMVGMMDAQRGFELASKAISMQDEMAGIANQVKQ